MAKTLVIKGANFSANKVATVVFADVPCTGISLDSDSYSVTSLGELSATYTVTPSNTTDAVTWTSSDTSVVNIVDGTPVVVGIGSCTVTVTCGTHSDSASVTVALSYTANWDFGMATISASNYISHSASNSRICTRGTGNQATTYKMIGAGYSDSAVKIPSGVGRIKITTTNPTFFYNNSASAKLIWGKDESAGDSTFPTAIKAISEEGAYNIRTDSTKTYTIPSGVDSFVFYVRMVNDASSGDDANTFATTGGLTIEFLPAA